MNYLSKFLISWPPRASASAWLYVILWKYNISWKKSSSLQLSIDKTNWAYTCSNDDQAVVDEYCKFLSFPQGKSCFARVNCYWWYGKNV